FFSSRRRHTRWPRDWSSDVCSSDLVLFLLAVCAPAGRAEERLYGVELQADAMVPMRDGVSLATDLYLPARSGKALAEKWPTILRSEERRVGKEWRAQRWWGLVMT